MSSTYSMSKETQNEKGGQRKRVGLLSNWEQNVVIPSSSLACDSPHSFNG